MPRPGPRRPALALRVSQEGMDALDALAEKAGASRSEMGRRLLSAAIKDPAIRRSVTRRNAEA